MMGRHIRCEALPQRALFIVFIDIRDKPFYYQVRVRGGERGGGGGGRRERERERWGRVELFSVIF